VGRILHLFISLSLLVGCASVEELIKLGDGEVVKVDDGTCLNLTAESKAHLVGICKYEDRFSFRINEEKLVYDKTKYLDGLRERLFSFIRSTEYPWKKLTNAKVDVWLQAPVFNPAKVYLTAVVISDAGSFAVDLPIDPNKWYISPEQIKLVPREGYPSLKTKQGGVLMVRAKPYISTERFQRFLAECGMPQEVHHHGQLIKTPVFGEAKFEQALRYHADAQYVLEDVQYVPVGEEDTSSAVGFSFPFFKGY
jgi:hypothetical protein